jgi:hypothetical protein
MLPLFFFLMLVILAAFYLGSRLIRIEYQFHRENWEDDGKPADYFSSVPGSYVSRFAVSTSWLFATPEWMKAESQARTIIIWYRLLCLIFVAGWIAMVYLQSKRP